MKSEDADDKKIVERMMQRPGFDSAAAAEIHGEAPRDNATVLFADYWSEHKRNLILAFNENPDIWYIAAKNKAGDEFLVFAGPHP